MYYLQNIVIRSICVKIMFFDPELTNAFRDALPWAGLFFRFITELGSKTFYVALILFGFWVFKKKESILTAYVLLTSAVLNYFLKIAIAIERPPEIYWYEGVEATNYSTPSGHSQNSATLFGWFASKIKTWWIFICSMTLIILIGLSRVYLGVHYLGDVLLGWGIGILSVILLVLLEKPLGEFFSRYRDEYIFTILFLFGLGATLVTTNLLPLPPNDNFGQLGGLMMGLAIAIPLEKRFVGFSVEVKGGQKWRLVLRVIFGLILIFVIMIGLSPILPATDVWLRTIRYMLVTFVGAFVWPFIFDKIGL